MTIQGHTITHIKSLTAVANKCCFNAILKNKYMYSENLIFTVIL